MRSRKARLSTTALAWIAIGAAAFFLLQSERQLARLRADFRGFDRRAGEAGGVLADLRTGQQAYVATGQGVQGAAVWIPRVTATIENAAQAIAALRAAARSIGARASLDEAADAMANFGAIDKRAQDYIKSDQPLMAGDVIFTEGSDAAAGAARQIEHARVTEHQALDASEAVIRQQQALALGGAAALSALTLLVLGFSRTEVVPTLEDTAVEPAPEPAAVLGPETLTAMTALCTDFGRARSLGDLPPLLPRVAQTLEASGLVVWLWESNGAALRPVLAHGYSASVLARMPNVPRSADNAAAAAYRSGALQTVARRGSSSGAVVAPILSSTGPVGVLSAEILEGRESSPCVHALASIFAAHLAAVLSAEPATDLNVASDRAAASL